MELLEGSVKLLSETLAEKSCRVISKFSSTVTWHGTNKIWHFTALFKTQKFCSRQDIYNERVTFAHLNPTNPWGLS